MSADTRYPELVACQAAQKALKDFDAAHKAKEEAIKTFARMLDRGGWASVVLDNDVANIPFRQRVPEDVEPVPINALGPPSLVEIVMDRRALVMRWQRAYESRP